MSWGIYFRRVATCINHANVYLTSNRPWYILQFIIICKLMDRVWKDNGLQIVSFLWDCHCCDHVVWLCEKSTFCLQRSDGISTVRQFLFTYEEWSMQKRWKVFEWAVKPHTKIEKKKVSGIDSRSHFGIDSNTRKRLPAAKICLPLKVFYLSIYLEDNQQLQNLLIPWRKFISQ